MRVRIKSSGIYLTKDGSELPGIELEVEGSIPETPGQVMDTYNDLSLKLRQFQLDQLIMKDKAAGE